MLTRIFTRILATTLMLVSVSGAAGAQETGLYTAAVQTVTATPLTTSTATTGRLGEDDQAVERGSFEAGARNVRAQEAGPVTELMYARVHLDDETAGWPFEIGRWSFGGRAGQTVEVEVASEHFNPVIGLISPAGVLLAMDDDGGSGTNSRLVATLPDDGVYHLLVMVHPFDVAADGGVYEVTVREVPEARDVVREREAFITLGTTERSTLDADRPETGNWSFEGRSGQTVEVEVASDKFDTVEPLAKLRGLRLGAVPNVAGEHPNWPGSPTWEDRGHAERWKSGVPTCSRPRVGTPVGD